MENGADTLGVVGGGGSEQGGEGTGGEAGCGKTTKNILIDKNGLTLLRKSKYKTRRHHLFKS